MGFHIVEELVKELMNRGLPLFSTVNHALVQTVIGQEIQVCLGVNEVSQVGDVLHVGVESSNGSAGEPGVEAVFRVQLADVGAGSGAEAVCDAVHLLIGRVIAVALPEQEALIAGCERPRHVSSARYRVGLLLDNQGVGLHAGIDRGGLVLDGLLGQFEQLGHAGHFEHVHALPAGGIEDVDRNADDCGVSIGEGQLFGLQVFHRHGGRILDVGRVGHLVQDAGLCADTCELGIEELGRKRPDSGDGESGSGL